LPNALSITGQNSSKIVGVVIERARPIDQNNFVSPPEPIIDSRGKRTTSIPCRESPVHWMPRFREA
jgi:hypothetical protein